MSKMSRMQSEVKEEEKVKMGRPEKPIDWKRVDDMIMAGCNGLEIAPHFNIHYTSFYDKIQKEYGMTFTEYSAQLYPKGDSLLRIKQFEKAMKGDNQMLMLLGKERLKQQAITDQKITVNIIKEKPYDDSKSDHTSQVSMPPLSSLCMEG